MTKEQVGHGNVDDVWQYSEANQPPYTVTSVNGMTGAVNIETPDISGLQTQINMYAENLNNPHTVTKEQIGLSNVPNVVPYHVGNKPIKIDVGLGNVDNTSDLSKPISIATQTALDNCWEKDA